MVENELSVHWEVAMDRPLSPRGTEPHCGLNLLQRYHPGTHIKKITGSKEGTSDQDADVEARREDDRGLVG